jgi:hypothetical protein
MNIKWSYLAGIFDGEGTIYIGLMTDKRRTFLKIGITNTDLNLMKWLIENFGGSYRSEARRNYRLIYRWGPKGKNNREKFLLGVLPYLIIKREQALLALEFDRMNCSDPEKRDKIRLKIQALNRGSVETNTQDCSPTEQKIESELTGDRKSAPAVTLEFCPNKYVSLDLESYQ